MFTKLTLWSGCWAVHDWQRKPPTVVVLKPLYSVPRWDSLHLDKSVFDVLYTEKRSRISNNCNCKLLYGEQTMTTLEIVDNIYIYIWKNKLYYDDKIFTQSKKFSILTICKTLLYVNLEKFVIKFVIALIVLVL